MRQSHKTILLWVLLILMFLSVYNLFQGQKNEDQKVQFSQFISRVEKDPQSVTKVVIKTAGSQGAPAEFTGEWKDNGVTKKFITTGLVTDTTMAKLQTAHINFEAPAKA